MNILWMRLLRVGGKVRGAGHRASKATLRLLQLACGRGDVAPHLAAQRLQAVPQRGHQVGRFEDSGHRGGGKRRAHESAAREEERPAPGVSEGEGGPGSPGAGEGFRKRLRRRAHSSSAARSSCTALRSAPT